MLENTGIVGVYFGPYICYAVVADILEHRFHKAIDDGFDLAKVQY